MSYQVLARKWRPRNFKEMAGQTHVLRTLINALDNQRLHHAYLFTGTRGVGKTTIARILARCLNCETGITSSPCGECSACREINEGRFLDLIEVDAASRTKVEDTRELLENVQYAPSRGRFKVYLIDEVHMLSTHSFNALLKTLEEPPPHVKFLLATTDPQKLPVTVLSRCLQFNLKNLSPERLVEHIRHILEQEKIAFEEGALWQLGRAAQGSVRDCLTLLDQAIGFCDGTVTDIGVREFLGNIDRSVIVALMDALVAQDAAAVLQQINIVAEHSPDFTVVLQELLSWLHRIAIAQVVPDGIDNSQGDRQQIMAHAGSLPAESVQLYYQIALKGREDMPYAPDARSGFEMVLLRMLAFTPAGMSAATAATQQSHGNASADLALAGGIAAEAGQKKKPVADPPSRAAPAGARHVTAVPSPAAIFNPVNAAQASSATTNTASASATVNPPTIGEASGTPVQTAPAATANNTKHTRAATGSHMKAGRDEAASSNTTVRTVTALAGMSAANAVAAPLRDASAGAEPDKTPSVPAAAKSLTSLQPAHWTGLFGQLPLSGVTRSIAANCVLEEVQGARLSLVLEENHATLFNEEHRKRMEAALTAWFAEPVALAITVGQVATETPAAFRKRIEAERQALAVSTFTEDALVRAIVERFDADIQYESITPTAPLSW